MLVMSLMIVFAIVIVLASALTSERQTLAPAFKNDSANARPRPLIIVDYESAVIVTYP